MHEHEHGEEQEQGHPERVARKLVGDDNALTAEWVRFEAEREAATLGITVDEFLAFRGLAATAASWEMNRARLSRLLAEEWSAEEGTGDYVRDVVRPDVEEAAVHLRGAVEDLVETWAVLAARDAFEASGTGADCG